MSFKLLSRSTTFNCHIVLELEYQDITFCHRRLTNRRPNLGPRAGSALPNLRIRVVFMEDKPAPSVRVRFSCWPDEIRST